MGELVLLVVAAAWAAVLIPPLLRSRIENRPNSSVTDFRRQLNKLQSTVPSRATGPMRGMARPLAQSPLQRPAAAGRPGMQPAQLRRGAGGRTHAARDTREVRDARTATPVREAPRRRTHGDPSGGQLRPHQHGQPARHPGERHHRQTAVTRHGGVSAEELRRRRSNVMFMLVLATAGAFFLAATTKEQIFYYLFALSFLALFGYAFLLSQVRQREAQSWPSDWMHH